MSKKILVISDVDGCLTTGHFIYTAEGKTCKVFGCNDHDGVRLLRKNDIDVEFITADKVGLSITLARITEMKCKCIPMSEMDRQEFIKEKNQDYDIVFFGDGIGDAMVKRRKLCTWFVVPANARKQAKDVADYVTEHAGGDGAFLDLAYWVCENLLENYKDLYDE